MVCIDICPNGAIRIEDNMRSYNAVIDAKKCSGCNVCKRMCQKNHSYQATSPLNWYQGWAKDKELRKRASSGGVASAVAESFIQDGGIVCSCTFKQGRFLFEFADRVEDIGKFTGSKYVKSDPSGIYIKIREKLQGGQKVLFIGLPCQVAALKNYIKGEDMKERLYTVDLICHGTPSPKLLELFLEQNNLSLKSIEKIIFRVKAKRQIHCDNRGIVTKGVSDKYTIAFLNALTYTENCYECDYAKLERVSDLTLGDSWGTQLSTEEQKRGVSLILSQSKKGQQMLENSKVKLLPVNLKIAIKSNHQLRHPALCPTGRDIFFGGIKKGRKFSAMVFQIYWKDCLRQDAKDFLIKAKVLHDEAQT